MEERKQLRMVTCEGCGAKVFIPGDMEPLATTACKKCGYAIMMPMMMRHFELRSFIASGGNGTVYRAWDTVLERLVALKVMKQEIATEPGALDAFYHEARVCASLNHTNIIHVHNFDEFEGQKYLVMELADNGSLDGRIDLYKRIPELEVLDVGIKMASALEMVLKHGYLHRDIKPGNILFNEDNEPKLVDFGLAKKADARHVPSDTVEGTVYYLAPEKIKREPETFLADMYSLGATLYYAITGHVPFNAPTNEELVMAHVNTPLTPPNHVLPEITQACSDAIARTLAKEPEHRFQTYDELGYHLQMARSALLIQQSQGVAAPEPGGKPGKGWWKKKSGE